jgi:cytochrome c-type biogenesis protein
LSHASFFVLGFGVIFVLTGAVAGALGGVIYTLLPMVVKIGGVILIVLGLHMTGLITIPFLAMEKRIELGRGHPKSYWRSFLVGVVFAAGWTPCVGPILGAILLLAADSQTATAGAGLLAIYALGLAMPFLFVALAVDVAVPALRRMGRYLRIVSIVGGCFLVAMGFLLLTGLWAMVVAWFGYVPY